MKNRFSFEFSGKKFQKLYFSFKYVAFSPHFLSKIFPKIFAPSGKKFHWKWRGRSPRKWFIVTEIS